MQDVALISNSILSVFIVLSMTRILLSDSSKGIVTSETHYGGESRIIINESTKPLNRSDGLQVRPQDAIGHVKGAPPMGTYRDGKIVIRASMAPFLNLLSTDGSLREEVLEAITSKENAAMIQQEFAKLRLRLAERESEEFEVEERSGRVGVRIGPVYNGDTLEIANFRSTLESALGGSRSHAFWRLLELTPDFIGMAGERFITLKDEGTNWMLNVEISGGRVPVQPEMYLISKEMKHESGLASRFSHILDLEKMLHGSASSP